MPTKTAIANALQHIVESNDQSPNLGRILRLKERESFAVDIKGVIPSQRFNWRAGREYPGRLCL
jgi:hypothetical protein